jgi:hypothetical protein
MAGPFNGVLLGTIGTRPGSSSMSPYLAMRQMQIAAEEQARAQAQQQMQFDAGLEQRQSEFASQQAQSKAEFGFKQQEAERAKSRYEMEFINREDQQKQQAENQKAELELRTKDQESLAKSREDKNLQDKTEFETKQAGEVAAKEENAQLSDLYTQARSIIAKRVPVVDVSGQGTPESIRDALLAELDQVDVSGQEKAVMQKAIDEWYKAETQKKKDDLAMQREERIAENEKADLEVKKRQIESYDNAKKMQAAQSASAPYRRQQESVVKQINDLDVKIAAIEGQLQGLAPDRLPFYQNALTGLRSAKDRLKARYDDLEAQASAREAEVLAKG